MCPPFSRMRYGECKDAYFKRVYNEKSDQDPVTIAKTRGMPWLTEFATELLSYDYSTKPSYDKLRFLLQMNI